MSQYTVEEVTDHKQARQFIDLPKRIYRDDPHWCCPLDNDIEKVFDPARNTLFDGGEAARWLLKDAAGMVVGRIAAFYNTEQAKNDEQLTGGCGFFECPDDPEAAALLFDTARQWLESKGMEAMDGPVNFGDRSDWWGVLVEGFEAPLYCCPYNPPYYKDLFEGYGFRNYFNQHTYLRELVDGKLNPALRVKAERLVHTPGYRFEYAGFKKLEVYAEDFRTVYNEGWATFSGVKPISKEHARSLLKKMKPILDVRLLYFAYYEDRPIGFFLMIPDLNPIVRKFNGKFGLWQKLRLIVDLKWRKKSDKVIGLIFGVVPEYQGKGVEAGMIHAFEKEFQTLHYKTLELSWIGDFNPVMMRVAESYVVANRYKMHTTYRYLFDWEKPFSRAPKLGRKRK